MSLRRFSLWFFSALVTAGFLQFALQDSTIIQASTLAPSQFAHSAALDLDFEYVASTTFDETQSAELFGRCETVVSKTLAALPASHVATVQLVTLTLDEDARRGLGGGSHIVIRCTGVSDTELAAVTIHEVGHTVDATLLQGTSQVTTAFSDGPYSLSVDDPSIFFYALSWVSDTVHTDTSSDDDFVSVYAASDPFEDFAESYVAYVLHGESFLAAAGTNPVLQAKYDFLKKIVFGGTTYALDTDSFTLPVRDVTILPYDFSILFSL